MKLSVVMPVYNTKEQFLREAIESVLNQTFMDFELLIINDGSTDTNVENVILSYKDKRIKYLKQENIGLARSLNKGFKLATGEYVARMDGDDISLPNRFAEQVEFLDKHTNISLCGSIVEKFRNNKSKIRKYPANPKILELLKECCICHPSIMIRIADFKKFNLEYNPDYKCEDYELWSRAIKYLQFYNIQKPLLKYRVHGNNLSLQAADFKNHVMQVKENIINYITSDKKLILALRKKYIKKNKFWKNLFSLSNGSTRKILLILGIKVPLWKL